MVENMHQGHGNGEKEKHPDTREHTAAGVKSARETDVFSAVGNQSPPSELSEAQLVWAAVRARLLIVDDDPNLRDMIAEKLTGDGYGLSLIHI